MSENEAIKSETPIVKQNNSRGFFLDLVLYIAIMFLVREIYFENVLATG